MDNNSPNDDRDRDVPDDRTRRERDLEPEDADGNDSTPAYGPVDALKASATDDNGAADLVSEGPPPDTDVQDAPADRDQDQDQGPNRKDPYRDPEDDINWIGLVAQGLLIVAVGALLFSLAFVGVGVLVDGNGGGEEEPAGESEVDAEPVDDLNGAADAAEDDDTPVFSVDETEVGDEGDDEGDGDANGANEQPEPEPESESDANGEGTTDDDEDETPVFTGEPEDDDDDG